MSLRHTIVQILRPVGSLCVGLAFCASALAQDDIGQAVALPAAGADRHVATAASTPAGAVSPGRSFALRAGKAIDDNALAGLRGGTETLNSIVSNGTVNNTSAVNVDTGNNSISQGAFANSVGLPTVIQNSGANVLIQNSTIINVQFRP